MFVRDSLGWGDVLAIVYRALAKDEINARVECFDSKGVSFGITPGVV